MTTTCKQLQIENDALKADNIQLNTNNDAMKNENERLKANNQQLQVSQ